MRMLGCCLWWTMHSLCKGLATVSSNTNVTQVLRHQRAVHCVKYGFGTCVRDQSTSSVDERLSTHHSADPPALAGDVRVAPCLRSRPPGRRPQPGPNRERRGSRRRPQGHPRASAGSAARRRRQPQTLQCWAACAGWAAAAAASRSVAEAPPCSTSLRKAEHSLGYDKAVFAHRSSGTSLTMLYRPVWGQALRTLRVNRMFSSALSSQWSRMPGRTDL